MAKSAGKKAAAADAEICMKFYDLRREAEMRKARSWFTAWMPQSFDDFLKISANPTAPEHAWFRQVVTYWDNGASLVLRGAVHRDMFMDWNQEMISRHPDTAAKRARFNHFLKEAGGAGREDIRTYFDLIEFGEGRLK